MTTTYTAERLASPTPDEMAPTIGTSRHSLGTRIMHWVNALCVFLVLMSGLQIFNAHPRLYWGQSGANTDHPLLQIGARDGPGDKLLGTLDVGRHELHTTGLLGVSAGDDGLPTQRAFPSWATIPSFQDLASGRRWHFFFGWLLVLNSVTYLIISVACGHILRDLLPTRRELSPSNIAREFWNHLRLRFPQGEAAKRYNVLQKLAYLGVIFVLGPLMLATGLTMSPGGDAAFPWLLDLFAGRQSARTLHFASAMLIALFIVVHLLMVVLAGPWNELRSMITGRYVTPSNQAK
jgi:thiosulfate reductase cytochrome b subunit